MTRAIAPMRQRGRWAGRASRARMVIWVVVRGRVGHRGLRLLTRRLRVAVLVVAACPQLGRVPLVAAERGAVEEAVVAHHELKPADGRGVGQVDGFGPRARRRSSPAPRKDMPRARSRTPAPSGRPLRGRRRPGTRASPPAGARSPGRSCSRCRVRRPAGSSTPSAACTPGACPEAPRDTGERHGHGHVTGVQVGDRAGEGVGRRGAGRAAYRGRRAEHEVIDEQLRAPAGKLWQRPGPSSVPKRYSFSMGTQGSSRRSAASWSPRRVSSFPAPAVHREQPATPRALPLCASSSVCPFFLHRSRPPDAARTQ
jgi:hypothetical protein